VDADGAKTKLTATAPVVDGTAPAALDAVEVLELVAELPVHPLSPHISITTNAHSTAHRQSLIVYLFPVAQGKNLRPAPPRQLPE
jgi:hypothetical protein